MSDVNTDTGVILEALNNKVDLDGNNLSVQGKSLISGLGMPSARYTDLTLLASGNTYTAPANGWLFFSKISTAANQYVTIGNRSASNIEYTANCVGSSNWLQCYIPAKKGDVIHVDYNLGGNTNYFRFIYAEGEE